MGTSPNGLVQRPEIAQAWQRAAMSGLTPSAALDRLPQVEVDERSRLLVAAGPVLDQVAEQLEGTRYCVLLADRDATIVDRRVGQVSLEAVLDGVGAMRGAQFCEELTGTNSIATVHELRRGMQVVGDEHYLEGLRSFCCYGHPIVNPLTRRLEGVLDITGHAGDTSDLLAPFLRTAARAIEQRLLLGARVAQQDLLAAFQAATGRTHEPVLVVGEGVCLASPSAMTELGPDDHLVLRALAAGEGRGGAVVTLASGRSAQVGMTPVRGGGVLIELTLGAPPSAVRSGSRPLAKRVPATALVLGEPGSGRTTWARSRSRDDDLLVLDALDDLGWEVWGSALRTRLREPGAVLLENVHRLPEPDVARLRHLLGQPLEATVTATAGPRSGLTGEHAALLTAVELVHELPALRNRQPEVPALAAAMLAELDPDGERRLSPSLLAALMRQPWPGNLHELKALLREVLAATDLQVLALDHLPPAYQGRSSGKQRTPLEESEYQTIAAALQDCGGNKARTAAQLGISRATLYTKIRTFGLRT